MFEGLFPVRYRRRIQWIDVARCLLIFTILYGHIYPYARINHYIHLFHVPAFFFLSGLVWREREEPFPAFFRTLTRRLLVPYWTAALLSIAAYLLMGRFVSSDGTLPLHRCLLGMLWGNVRTDLMIWNKPLWFIPCLFSVRMLWEGIRRAFRVPLPRILGVLTILGVGLLVSYRFRALKLPFSLESACVMLAFFGLGVLVRRLAAQRELRFPGSLPLQAFLFVACFAACLFFYDKSGTISVSSARFGNFPVLFLTAPLGTIMVCLLARWIEGARFLQMLGQNTLSILLWHKFPVILCQMSALRRFENRWDNPLAIFAGLFTALLACLFSLFVAWILEKLLRRKEKMP